MIPSGLLCAAVMVSRRKCLLVCRKLPHVAPPRPGSALRLESSADTRAAFAAATLARDGAPSELPARICIVGPPASGARAVAAAVAGALGVPHLHVPRAALISSRGEGITADTAQIALEEAADTFMDPAVAAGAAARFLRNLYNSADAVASHDQPQNRRGWVLSGYPNGRLEALTGLAQAPEVRPDVVVQLELQPQESTVRALGRRLDPVTGAIYSPEHPPSSRIIDRLIRRPRDEVRAVTRRVAAFQRSLPELRAVFGASRILPVNVQLSTDATSAFAVQAVFQCCRSLLATIVKSAPTREDVASSSITTSLSTSYLDPHSPACIVSSSRFFYRSE